MRFLHTSDWHLGRTLRGFDLHHAQADAVSALVDAAIDAECDAFIIAGDVFDRAFPPVQSVEVFSTALTRLHESGITSIVVAGNHDSGPRLAMYSALLSDGVHIVGDVQSALPPIEVGDALVYALPYLNPDEVRATLSSGDEPLERSHHAVLDAAMSGVRADIAARNHLGPVVVVAHAFVAGAVGSESERDIAVGGVPVVDASVFDGADYVALGHLHRPQTVSHATRMEYSGSLLRYSASEAEHVKRALIVELDVHGASVTEVEIEQPRPMVRLTGTCDELLARTEHAESFVELTVTDERMPERMHPRLKAAFPFALQIRRAPASSVGVMTSTRGSFEGKSPEQTIIEFFTKTTGLEPDEAERAVIAAVVES